MFEDIIKELFEETKIPSDKQVIEMYDKNNLLSFEDSKAINLANGIIDLQNHLILAKLIQNGTSKIDKKEYPIIIEHLTELRNWIRSYINDSIRIIGKTITKSDYSNMTREELIEELKKLKRE